MAESFKSSSFSCKIDGAPFLNPVIWDDCGKLTGAGPSF